MQPLSIAQIIFIQRENAEATETLSPLPARRWPDRKPGIPYPIKALRNKRFLVQIYKEADGVIRLSVNTTEIDMNARRFKDGISWDELQDLKAQAGYADRWAVEIYPPDENVVNVANMRHLWLLKEAPPYAWKKA